jgi:hypothetical protein
MISVRYVYPVCVYPIDISKLMTDIHEVKHET